MKYQKTGFFLFVGIVLGLTGCKREHVQEGIPVVVGKVGLQNVEIFGEYVGRIRALQFVEIRARVEGYLEKNAFRRGEAREP